MKRLLVVALILFISGCEDRECLKSHTESSCACVCTNNVGIPIHNTYQVCDIYKEENQ